jgi:PadR family transcriptional regulator, regulatory protein PadR
MSNPGHDSQLLKGVLVLVLLRLLDQQESYGYELVGRVHSAGLPGVAEGSVYPALARLERDGLVLTRLVTNPAGPRRKYYRLSPAGLRDLRDRAEAWRTLAASLNDLLDHSDDDRRVSSHGRDED